MGGHQRPDGTGVRDYSCVMALAEGHLAAVNVVRDECEPFEAFNLGSGLLTPHSLEHLKDALAMIVRYRAR